MHRRLVATVALLLAVPNVAGHDVATVATTFTASAIQTQSPSTITGDLIGFLQGASASGLPSASFHFAADKLHMERDHADVSVHASIANTHVYPKTITQDHNTAKLAGTDVRDAARWTLVPLPGHAAPKATLTAGCGTLAPSDADRIERLPWVQQRPPIVVDAARATAWTACGSMPILTIRGDFLLVLWDIDAHLTSSEGSQDLHTGKQPEGAGLPRAGVTSDEEAYLYATNAILETPVNPDTSYNILLAAADLATQGTILLQDGHLVSYGAANAAVRLEGDLHLVATAGQGGMAGTIHGLATRIMAGDSPVALTATVATPGWTWWSWYAALGAIPAMIALGAFFIVWQGRHLGKTGGPISIRHAASIYFAEQAERALDQDAFGRAKIASALAGACRPNGYEALVVEARLRWEKRDVARQLVVHQKLSNILSDPKMVADNCLMAARGLCRAGRDEEGLAWLRMGDEADPRMVAASLHDPYFSRLRTSPWVRLRIADLPMTPGYT